MSSIVSIDKYYEDVLYFSFLEVIIVYKPFSRNSKYSFTDHITCVKFMCSIVQLWLFCKDSFGIK